MPLVLFYHKVLLKVSFYFILPAGTPEAENSPKDGLGMATLGGQAEKNRKLQKK